MFAELAFGYVGVVVSNQISSLALPEPPFAMFAVSLFIPTPPPDSAFPPKVPGARLVCTALEEAAVPLSSFDTQLAFRTSPAPRSAISRRSSTPTSPRWRAGGRKRGRGLRWGSRGVAPANKMANKEPKGGQQEKLLASRETKRKERRGETQEKQ